MIVMRVGVDKTRSVLGLTLILYSINAHSQYTQQEIASKLASDEALAVTAHATVEYRVIPTAAEVIPKIQRIIRELHPDSPDQWNAFVYNEQDALVRSRDIEWWRKGDRERVDVFASDVSKSFEGPHADKMSYEAFDGSIVRTYAKYPDEVRGAIGSMESTDRNQVNRNLPFSFLHEYVMTPFSDIIRDSPNFAVTRASDKVKELVEVSFSHPAFTAHSFVARFDEDTRLVERDLYIRTSADPDSDSEQRLYTRTNFADYELFTAQDGSLIWFPTLVEEHFFLDDPTGGDPVEYHSVRAHVYDIEFNAEIENDWFVLEFPKGARIYDKLTGLGWLSGEGSTLDQLENDLSSVIHATLEDPSVIRPTLSDGLPEASEKATSNGPANDWTSPQFRLMMIVLSAMGILAFAGFIALRYGRSASAKQG